MKTMWEKAEPEWADEILTDGRLTTVAEEVRRKMAHFAAAAARPYPQIIFVSPLVHEFRYEDGAKGTLECWTEVDDGAELANLIRASGAQPVRTFRRLTLDGDRFSASALQFWTASIPHSDEIDIEGTGDHPPWTGEPEIRGDLRSLLRFLRVSWRRPLRLAQPPYRATRFFETYEAKGTVIEVVDGFELGRKLRCWERNSRIDDDDTADSLRPVSAFIDFLQGMSGDLLIEPRKCSGETHSSLIFEFDSQAEDFLRRFTAEKIERKTYMHFFRRFSHLRSQS